MREKSIRNRNSPLFYCPENLTNSDEIVLSGSEGKHALSALRLNVADQVQLTDGGGILAHGQILHIEPRKGEVQVKIESTEHIQSETPRIILATALPKGDRQSTLIDMVTQLGIDQFIPLLCDHSSVSYKPNMGDRWKRIMISACKQARRVHIPTVDTPMPLVDLVTRYQKKYPILVSDQTGKSIYSLQKGIIGESDGIVLVVGPEGGLSEQEFQLIHDSDIEMIGLGRHILRIETACVAIISAVNSAMA